MPVHLCIIWIFMAPIHSISNTYWRLHHSYQPDVSGALDFFVAEDSSL